MFGVKTKFPYLHDDIEIRLSRGYLENVAQNRRLELCESCICVSQLMLAPENNDLARYIPRRIQQATSAGSTPLLTSEIATLYRTEESES